MGLGIAAFGGKAKKQEFLENVQASKKHLAKKPPRDPFDGGEEGGLGARGIWGVGTAMGPVENRRGAAPMESQGVLLLTQ